MATQIKAHRIRNNLTQSGLAKLLGISQQAVQRIEAGLARPSLGMAIRISQTLRVTPCVILPELAVACAGPPILHAPGSERHAFSATAAANWRVQIAGADRIWTNYWVGEDEARRIQESLARFNSASAALDSNFLAFRTAERAVAVNLNVIDRLSLEFSTPDDPLRRTPPLRTTGVHLFLRDGPCFSSFVLHVSRDEDEVFSSNFLHLTQVGNVPFFSVTKEATGVHLLSTKQIAVIEMAQRLVNAKGTAAISSQGHDWTVYATNR